MGSIPDDPGAASSMPHTPSTNIEDADVDDFGWSTGPQGEEPAERESKASRSEYILYP